MAPIDGPLERFGRAALPLEPRLGGAGRRAAARDLLMTVASVAMRATLGFPILGDFELVELGTAIAVFAFLPYCHQAGGNVWSTCSPTARPSGSRAGLAALGSLVRWRSRYPGLARWRRAATTSTATMRSRPILASPRWWAFPPILISLALLALVTLVSAARRADPSRRRSVGSRLSAHRKATIAMSNEAARPARDCDPARADRLPYPDRDGDDRGRRGGFRLSRPASCRCSASSRPSRSGGSRLTTSRSCRCSC